MEYLKEYLGISIETLEICISMRDQIKIQHIRELVAKSQESRRNGDLNSEKSCLINILSLIEELSPKFKEKFNNGSFNLHLELSKFFINDHQYKEAIDTLETAKTLPEYKNLETTIKCEFCRCLSYSKLFLGLNNNSKMFINEAKELNAKLIENSGKITSGELKKAVLDDKKIIEAWEQNDIKTTIEFEIPFPLIILDRPIEFEFDSIKHNIEIELIQSPLSPIPTTGGWFAEIVEDKYGLALRSKIKLTFSKYIDPHETVVLNVLAQDKSIHKILLETIKVMNFFIERYRIASEKYWLENIFHKMIQGYLCTVTAGTVNVHRFNTIKNQMLKLQTGVPWLSQEMLDEFENNLKKDKLDLWKSLLLDSKDYLLRRNYRESIYAINGALENFLNQKARERLKKVLKEEEIEEFFEGKIKYEEHRLKDYMDKDSFEKAISSKAIPTLHPSVNQIIGKCHKLVPFPISRKELNKIVYKIRKRRNDIMHGNEIHEDLEKDAKIAIESFESFVDLFENY